MDAFWKIASYLLWAVWTVLTWLAAQLFWLTLWVLLPAFIAAVLMLRVAERFWGTHVVRAWAKRQSLKFSIRTWHRARRLLFVLGVLPFWVLGWFVIYAVWHNVISLWWRPRWSPWQRAWARRWRQPRARSRAGGPKPLP